MDDAEDAADDAPPGPRWAAVLIGVVVAAGSGFVGLPVTFLIAYGFAEQVTTFMHVVFLVLSLVLAMVATGITWPVLSAGMRYGAARGLGGALALVGATYAAVLGVGTVVALLNEDQGSVTADQPGAPFVVLVLVCAALAAGGGVAAARVLRTSSPGRSRTYVASPDSKSGGPYRQTNRGSQSETVTAQPGQVPSDRQTNPGSQSETVTAQPGQVPSDRQTGQGKHRRTASVDPGRHRKP